MRKLARISVLALAALVVVTTGGAFAQELDILTSAQEASGTPDGETPAAETVCDGLEGAQFGLCNAYCEAMDCDSANPNANATACAKVRERYLEKGGDESRLSCGCPCDFSTEGLDAFFGATLSGKADACFNISPATGFPDEGYALTTFFGGGSTGGQAVAVVEFAEIFNTPDAVVHPSCALQDPFDPTRPQDYVGGLTVDQAIACRNELLDYNACDCGSATCVLP
jgi:hypothetical protein